MKKSKTSLLATVASLLAVLTSPASAQTFSAQSAGDFGGAHPSYPASNAIDGNTAFASRWAANYNNSGNGTVNLFVDLGSVQRVDDIGVAWGRGDSRSYNFEVRARAGTSGTWTKIRNRANSSGSTSGIEVYNVDDFDARQVRIKVFSTSNGSDWADVTEFEVYGTAGSSGGNSGGGNNGGGGGGSAAVSVPAKIEAEDFTNYSDTTSNNIGGQYRSTGVDIQATGDAGGGFNVGWVANGEWLEYEIDVSSSGSYQVDTRVASTNGNGQFFFSVDGTRVSNNIGVNNTGNWQNFYTETVDLGNLSAGTHTLRVTMPTGSFNINWLDIKSGGNNNGGGGGGGTGEFGLDPNADPWDNFDLSQWKLDTPASRSSSESCKTQFTEPQDWQSDFPSASGQYFFTHTDGGMRFVSEIGGATTGGNCNSRTRSELREMLRGSDTSIDTDGKTDDGDDDGDFRNNWALGYQPTTKAGNNNESWGAREGKMRATLRVNKVTTTGSDSSRGRVVIGQIHAKDDEPLRLNYKHRVGFDGGCIYASSEQNGGSDTNYVLAGSNTSCSSDPGNNGLGLGDLFSYEIENINEDIVVTIYQGDFGAVIDTVTIDLNDINGGYDLNNDWMYFKAGAYTQNSLGDGGSSGDGDVVTFYRLDVTH